MTKRVSTEQIKQAMKVRNYAASLLLDHEDDPVDAWELVQETGLTEKQVNQSLKYLVNEDLIEMDKGKVTAVLPMATEAIKDEDTPEPDPETVKAYEQEHTYNTFIARAAANLDIPLDYFKSWQELGPEGQENFRQHAPELKTLQEPLQLNDPVAVEVYEVSTYDGRRKYDQLIPGRIIAIHNYSGEYSNGQSVQVELSKEWRGAKLAWFDVKDVKRR